MNTDKLYTEKDVIVDACFGQNLDSPIQCRYYIKVMTINDNRVEAINLSVSSEIRTMFSYPMKTFLGIINGTGTTHAYSKVSRKEFYDALNYLLLKTLKLDWNAIAVSSLLTTIKEDLK